jgi:hypothetical protein
MKICIFTIFIRRGGTPSGAAAFIFFGGRGVSTPISNSCRGQFSWEIIKITRRSRGFAPHARGAPVAIVPHSLETKRERMYVQVIPGHHMCTTQRVQGLRKGVDHIV